MLAASVPHLDEAATVVVERDSRAPEPLWPAGLRAFHQRTYGSTALWLAEVTPSV